MGAETGKSQSCHRLSVNACAPLKYVMIIKLVAGAVVESSSAAIEDSKTMGPPETGYIDAMYVMI